MNAGATAAARASAANRFMRAVSLCSALDSRALVHLALRVHGQVGEERGERVGHVAGLGEALLPEAVPQPPLQRVHHAACHAVTRPALVAADRLVGTGEVRQLLGADALAVLAVAGRAGEVVAAGTVEEDLAPDRVGFALLGMRLRRRDLHAARLTGDESGDR